MADLTAAALVRHSRDDHEIRPTETLEEPDVAPVTHRAAHDAQEHLKRRPPSVSRSPAWAMLRATPPRPRGDREDE